MFFMNGYLVKSEGDAGYLHSMVKQFGYFKREASLKQSVIDSVD